MVKTSRTPWVLVASFLLLAALAIPLRAQIWIGDGDGDDVTLDSNWTAPIEIGANVVFDNTAISFYPFVPSGGAQLNNLTFNGTGRGEYNFYGDSDSILYFTGDMDVATPGDVYFSSGLGLMLSDSVHNVQVTDGATVVVSSNIDDAGGGGSINMTGTGTILLEGTNHFGGGFTVNGGTVVLGDYSNIDGSVVYSSPVGLGTLTLNTGSTLSMKEEYTYRLGNDIVLDTSGGAVNFDIPNYSELQVSSYISGNAGINKTGVGDLVLSNANSDFSGGVSVYAGTLTLAESSDNSNGLIGPVGSGALKFSDGTTLMSTTSGGVLHNAIELDSNAGGVVHFEVGSDNSLALTGTISGAAKLAKVGDGTLDLYGNNTFTGALATGESSGPINIHGDTSAGLGRVELGDYTGINFLSTAPVIHGLQGSSFTSVAITNGSTLTINQGGSNNFAGSIGGTTASVVIAGMGTQTFSGANSYSGGTTINAGTLVANHGDGSNFVDALGSGTVTVDGGKLQIGEGLTLANTLVLTSGTFGGNYTFSTLQTFGAGITLSPGNSPGTMTFAAGYSPTNGVSTNIEINGASDVPGTNSDLIVTQGPGLNLSSLTAGGYTLHLISLSLMNNDMAGPVDGLSGGSSWTIFQNSALTGYNANLFTLDQSGFVGAGSFSLGLSGNDIVLTFTPVPEPSTYALLALGLAGSGLAAWRRRISRRL